MRHPHPSLSPTGRGVSDLFDDGRGGRRGHFAATKLPRSTLQGCRRVDCGLRETCSSSSLFRTGILSSRRWLLVMLQITSHHFNAVGSGCKGGMRPHRLGQAGGKGREGNRQAGPRGPSSHRPHAGQPLTSTCRQGAGRGLSDREGRHASNVIARLFSFFLLLCHAVRPLRRAGCIGCLSRPSEHVCLGF